MRALVVLALGGCVLRDDIVHITLRDPARVAIHAAGAPVLDEKVERADVPQAAFLRSPVSDAWLERHGTTIEAWCNSCRKWKRRTVIDAPLIDLDGTADEVVRFADGTLHARYQFADGVPGRRGWFQVPRFELEVVTPVDNVVSIDAESRVSPRNGSRDPTGELVFGGVFGGGGLGILALGLEHHEAGVDATGIGMMVVAAAVVGFALHVANARDSHVAIRP